MNLKLSESLNTQAVPERLFTGFAGRSKNKAFSYDFDTLNQSNKPERSEQIANRMHCLLAALPAGVIVLDGEGYIQESNQAAIDLLEEPLTGEKWVKVIQRAFAPQPDDGHDVSLKDGRKVHISTSPLDDEPGQIVLLHDVTETRQLQNKVSHLQRLSAMGEMAARLAHQIRTPLSSALLYLAPLLKSDTEKSLQQRFAKRLHASLTHMEQLVRDMLAFSRGDMASTALIAIDELLQEVEQSFQSFPDAERYQLQIQNEASHAQIYGSKAALASALNNLLNNAVQACGDEGEITIFAEYVQNEAGSHCVEISVEDNGVGIAEADKARVLAPFYTTRSSGTGLGLAVVQSIVTAHKGELWLDSEEGEGSTFSVRLPVYSAQTSLAAQI